MVILPSVYKDSPGTRRGWKCTKLNHFTRFQVYLCYDMKTFIIWCMYRQSKSSVCVIYCWLTTEWQTQPIASPCCGIHMQGEMVYGWEDPVYLQASQTFKLYQHTSLYNAYSSFPTLHEQWTTHTHVRYITSSDMNKFLSLVPRPSPLPVFDWF